MTASDETARDWLLRQASPEAADDALARSLTSTLGVTAFRRTEHRFPQDAPAYRVTVGCDFEIQDRANIPAAIAKIEQAMTPATADQCEAWLVMLQAATAHRADSDATSAVAYGLYAAELRQWPADVAKSACEKLARGRRQGGTNWFPTLAELVAECERLAAPRRVMLAALHNWAPKAAPFPSARGRPEPIEAEKEAVRRMAATALSELAATSATKARGSAPLPSISGKVDERGITQEMRDLIARRQAEAR